MGLKFAFVVVREERERVVRARASIISCISSAQAHSVLFTTNAKVLPVVVCCLPLWWVCGLGFALRKEIPTDRRPVLLLVLLCPPQFKDVYRTGASI